MIGELMQQPQMIVRQFFWSGLLIVDSWIRPQNIVLLITLGHPQACNCTYGFRLALKMNTRNVGQLYQTIA